MGNGELVRHAVDVVEVAVRGILVLLLELLGVELLIVEAAGRRRLRLGLRGGRSAGVDGVGQAKAVAYHFRTDDLERS